MELYKPRDQFLPFHLRDKRWSCIVAHRRAGKTVACINELITRALATAKKNARYAYIGPFYRQVKAVAWDYLKRYAEPIMTAKNEVDLEVTLPNGAKVRLFGADNPDSLRGLYLDGAILDEFADMKPSVWGSVIRPMLADRKGWAVFIGTPKGHNGFYDINKISKADLDWFHVTLRASESGLLDAEELRDAKKTMSEDEYEREFECSFDAAIQGAVYGRWMADATKEGRITRIDHDPKLPVYTAWDLGYSDATVIWFYQVAMNEVRLIDYFEGNFLGAQECAEQVTGFKFEEYYEEGKLKYRKVGVREELEHRRKYRYAGHFGPADAAFELQAANGRSFAQQMGDMQVKMKIVPETTHMNAHEAVRITLPFCYFDGEKCEQGVESLKQYQYEYDEEKKIYTKKPRHDWTSHASRAFDIIARVWREPKKDPANEKPRFLNDMTANEVFWSKTGNQSNISRI